MREDDKAGTGARWFFHVAAVCVVNRYVGRILRFAEMSGELCGEKQTLLGRLFARKAQDDMGARNILGMKP